MNSDITIMTVLLSPLNDYIKSFSVIKDKRQFWAIFFFLFFGFTGIPMMKFGYIKKGLIIMGCLIVGAGSNLLFDIAIIRQIFCIILIINYLSSFWDLLQSTKKPKIFKIVLIVLCIVPIELAVVYLFQLG